MDVSEGAKAMESIRNAEHLAVSGNNWELLASIYNLKGVILYVSNKKDSALVLYNQALELGKSHSIDPINFPRILSNIGECYQDDNPALAFDYWRQALDLADKTGNQIAGASITSIVGHGYLRKNDLKNAETNL